MDGEAILPGDAPAAPQDSLVVFVKASCKTGIPWRPAAR